MRRCNFSSQVLLLSIIYSACGFHAPGFVRTGSRQMPLRMMAGASAPGSGGMVDGVRIGPPPDMPSLLLNNRIVYLGMPINAAVTELIIGELLYLQYDSSVKPCLMYINSPGTTTEDGLPVGDRGLILLDRIKSVEKVLALPTFVMKAENKVYLFRLSNPDEVMMRAWIDAISKQLGARS